MLGVVLTELMLTLGNSLPCIIVLMCMHSLLSTPGPHQYFKAICNVYNGIDIADFIPLMYGFIMHLV